MLSLQYLIKFKSCIHKRRLLASNPSPSSFRPCRLMSSNESTTFFGRLSKLASILTSSTSQIDPSSAISCTVFMPDSSRAAPLRDEEVITVGGGCFWCVEACLSRAKGVRSAISGYAGGNVKNPTYEQVCSGRTGHTEVVRVTFDPNVISARELYGMFFSCHDPTTPNRQGHDIGSQYRSAVYCHSPLQLRVVQEVINYVESEKLYGDKSVVTEVKMTSSDDINYPDEAPDASQSSSKFNLPVQVGRLGLPFFPAEGYHQGYFGENPGQGYCVAVVGPKVTKFRKQFLRFLKEDA